MAIDERYAAFLFYVEDWLSSTAIDLMSAGEERGFLRLLLHAWKTPSCSLPNDDRVLAHLSKLGKSWYGKSGAAVRSEFIERDGRLFNERLLRERENQMSKRQAKSGAGKAGAAARWLGKECENLTSRNSQMKSEQCSTGTRSTTTASQTDDSNNAGDGNAIALPIADAQQTVWRTDASSSTSLKALVKTTSNTCASDDARLSGLPPAISIDVDNPPFDTLEPDGRLPGCESLEAVVVIDRASERKALVSQQEKWFSEWWTGYWRKESRKPAWEKFRRLVLTEERFQEVIKATRAQTPAMLSRESCHRPLGSTWLFQERWTDESAEAVKRESQAERIARMICSEREPE